MKYKNKKSGFTLMEILIYVAIFAMLAGVVITSFTIVVGTFSNSQTNRDLQESGSTAMERMAREIRQASGVNVSNSVFGVTPGTLELDSTDSSGTARTVKFVYENNAIDMYYGGVLQGNLLGQNIVPTSLFFRNITTTSGSAIKIEMTIEDNRGKDHRTANYYDTIILRSAY